MIDLFGYQEDKLNYLYHLQRHDGQLCWVAIYIFGPLSTEVFLQWRHNHNAIRIPDDIDDREYKIVNIYQTGYFFLEEDLTWSILKN